MSTPQALGIAGLTVGQQACWGQGRQGRQGQEVLGGLHRGVRGGGSPMEGRGGRGGPRHHLQCGGPGGAAGCGPGRAGRRHGDEQDDGDGGRRRRRRAPPPRRRRRPERGRMLVLAEQGTKHALREGVPAVRGRRPRARPRARPGSARAGQHHAAEARACTTRRRGKVS